MYIETYDLPFTYENRSMQHSAFVNDSWNIRRFTFNAGVRFDAFQPSYPEQQKTGAGPYQQAIKFPAFKFHWQNAFQPYVKYPLLALALAQHLTALQDFVQSDAGKATAAINRTVGWAGYRVERLVRHAARQVDRRQFVDDLNNLVRVGTIVGRRALR